MVVARRSSRAEAAQAGRRSTTIHHLLFTIYCLFDVRVDRLRVARAVNAAESARALVVVEERTSQPDCRNGYVLDGFPRTTAQAEMLERLAASQGKALVAVFVDVPFDIIEKRVTGRRSCPVCGEIYNVYFKPPAHDEVCDLHPEAKLNRRTDDNAETIKARLATYEHETRPLLDYYERTGRLRRVDGARDTGAIYADIEKAVNGE